MYRLTLNPHIVQRLRDGAFIPADQSNYDWREYQNWLLEGGNPEPAKDPPKVQMKKPSLAQIYHALKAKGILSDADL